jgi:hypothetical protein
MTHFKATAEGMIPLTEEEEAQLLIDIEEGNRFRVEVFSSRVREERNAKLTSSDWTQALDIPEATRTTWATYRQALRDVPTQPGFPEDITWPTPP